MEAAEFMELFDSCWFEMEIFKKQRSLSKLTDDANPDHQTQQNTQRPELFGVPTIITRSMSDQLCPRTSSSSSAESLSLESTSLSPTLKTIPSGIEITEESEVNHLLTPKGIKRVKEPSHHKRKSQMNREKEKKGLSKSLSELEFEELKGFMDLGFVFSEKDKDSSLVSIIPGLQRLGKKNEGENIEEEKVLYESTISRPYLSEAWQVFDNRKTENDRTLKNWRIPSVTNEIGVKDNLRWWAQTVASTVR